MYLGERNAAARTSKCPHCEAEDVTLTSYDTRLVFAVIFIPVIPLWRYRILDQCSTCRKHWYKPLAEIEAEVKTAVEPLEEKFRFGDAKAGIAAGQKLLEFQRFEEARSLLGRVVAEHPGEPEAWFHLGIAHELLRQW